MEDSKLRVSAASSLHAVPQLAIGSSVRPTAFREAQGASNCNVRLVASVDVASMNRAEHLVVPGPVRCWVTVFASAPLGKWPLVAADGWYPGHWDRTPSSSTTTPLSAVFQPTREKKRGSRPRGGTGTPEGLVISGCTRRTRPGWMPPAARRTTGRWCRARSVRALPRPPR